MSHKPRRDLKDLCDVPGDVVPVRPTDDEVEQKRMKSVGKPAKMNKCPMCKKNSVPADLYGPLEYCLRCSYTGKKK